MMKKGIGYEGSVGYRFLLNPSKSTLFFGARIDLFNTKIKWKMVRPSKLPAQQPRWFYNPVLKPDTG
jgi:hypothetical protein